MNEIERQLKAWERRERLGPGSGPVDPRQPGGYSADELAYNLSSPPADPLPADFFRSPETTSKATVCEPETTLHDEWMKNHILRNTGVVSEKRALEWTERRIKRLK